MRWQTSMAPHTVQPPRVRRIMGLVLLMLVPATMANVSHFGPGLLVQLLIAMLIALATEAAMLTLHKQPLLPFLTDGSALVTAALFAFSLPPLSPWWLATSGAAFAIMLGKHLFGGLGRNPFNPAMVGVAMLLVAFPVQMTRWSGPQALAATSLSFTDSAAAILGYPPPTLAPDAITSATPLATVHNALRQGQTLQEAGAAAHLGTFGIPGSEWISLAILAGGMGLLFFKVIRWHIPVGMLAGVIASAEVLKAIDPGTYSGALFHLTSGATLLGAFFIACDPVTAAASDKGRLLFGAGIGILTVALRNWGQYPDGVAFAVLTMNLFVPLIDRYTVPRIYGHARS